MIWNDPSKMCYCGLFRRDRSLRGSVSGGRCSSAAGRTRQCLSSRRSVPQEGGHLVRPRAPCCRRRSPRVRRRRNDFAPAPASPAGPENLAFKIGGMRIRPAERGARRAAHAQNGLPVPRGLGSRGAGPNPRGAVCSGGLSCGSLDASESC